MWCIVLTGPVFINTSIYLLKQHRVHQPIWILKTTNIPFLSNKNMKEMWCYKHTLLGCMIHWSSIIPPRWLFLCLIHMKLSSIMILLSGRNCTSRTLLRYERKNWCDIYSDIKSGGSRNKGTWDWREKIVRQLFSSWSNVKQYISPRWLCNVRLPNSTICIFITELESIKNTEIICAIVEKLPLAIFDSRSPDIWPKVHSWSLTANACSVVVAELQNWNCFNYATENL